MKIDTHFKPPPLSTNLSPATKTPVPASTVQSAEVRLSEVAAQLSAGDNSAPINRAKIEEIKQAITEGRFKINPEAIADGLLDTSRQLIESQRRE